MKVGPLEDGQHFRHNFALGYKIKILTMHVLLMLILDESISSRLLLLGILDDVYALDGSILIKLSSQLALACVVVNSGDKQCLEGIPSLWSIWIPDGNLLLQLVRDLFRLLLLSPLPPLLPCLDLDRSRSVHRILEQVNILGDPLVVVGLLLLMRKFVHRGQVGDRIPRGKQRQ